MKNRLPAGVPPFPTKSQWPSSKSGVMQVAHDWYDANIARVDVQVIACLQLPPIKTGAEPGMTVGRMEFNLTDNIELSLALNAINYQFWDLSAQGDFLRYDFEGIVGAQGMRTAFERAWADPSSPLSKARLGKPLTLEGIAAVFGDIPAAQSRADVLNEMLLPPKLSQVSARLAAAISKFGGVEVSQANLVAEQFPLAYGDPVLKKAQLALSEVWVNLDASAPGAAVCDLTAFADYQIPNILRAMGVLHYSEALAEKIENFQEIPYGSDEEKAIRGASLIAVEEIAKQAGVPVAAVDHYLWMRRKEAATPFHLTFTTAY